MSMMIANPSVGLKSIFQDKSGQGHSDALHKPWGFLKSNAAKRFFELDFPSRKMEDWKYTSLTSIIDGNYQTDSQTFTTESDQISPFLSDGLDTVKLVFVNGVLNEKWSDWHKLPEGLKVSKLAESTNLLDAFILEQWEKALNSATHALIPMNLAFSPSGYSIRVDKNAAITKPLVILHLSASTSQPILVQPQLFLQMEEGSKLTLVEYYQSDASNDGNFYNSFNRFRVASNATLRHFKIQNFSTAADQITNTEVIQERDSVYHSMVSDLGGRIIRNNHSAILNGPNTETHLLGIYVPTKGQHIDNQTLMDHANPHCYSNELYKGVIGEEGRGVFNGKVMVRKDAQKTNAFQQNANLLLAATAIMDTKPQLEIFADDVKCSHGATIGQLDEGAIFYLKSRGITDREARAILQYAFLGDVIEKIENEALRLHIEQLVQKKLENLTA